MEQSIITDEEIEARLRKDIELLTSPQGYFFAGIPKFRRLFGRDSCIAALQLLDIMPEISRSTLEILTKYQGCKADPRNEEEPGKILHEHYPGGILEQIQDLWRAPEKIQKIKLFFTWRFPYYGSVDSTAWFLILLSRYWKKTNDSDFVQKLWPRVTRAISWVEEYGDFDRDGLIKYQRKNGSGLFHQSWKDGLNIEMIPPVAMVEVQGYYYLAYREMALLAGRVMNDDGLRKQLEDKADTLKQKFNNAFWMAKEEFFSLALDGRKEQVKLITSNPGHCLFTGIVADDKRDQLVCRLFQDDIWTPYGIRTHSTHSPGFDPRSYQRGSIWPHDNWIIYTGLRMYGYYDYAEKIKNALLAAYRELGRIPELYGYDDGRIIALKNACYPQAWATGALLNMLEDENATSPP